MIPNRAGHTLSMDAVARMVRAIIRSETLTRENDNVTPTPGFSAPNGPESIVWPAECTDSMIDTPSELHGLYPGVIYVPKETDPADWTSEDVYLRPLTGGTFDIGAQGIAKLTGWAVLLDGTEGRPVYTFVPATAPAAAAGGFFARLTTASSGVWKWVALTLNSVGAFIDDGTETASFNATPARIDGTNLCNPVAGLRVWMIPSKQASRYEFLPYGYAASGLPGVVSITTQTFSGAKTFENTVQVTTGGPGIVSYGGVSTWSLRCADSIECAGSLYVTGNNSGSADGWVALQCSTPATSRYIQFSGYGAFPPDNYVGVVANSLGPGGIPSGVPAFEIYAGHNLFIRSPEVSVNVTGGGRKTCLSGTFDLKDGAGVTRYLTFEGGWLVDWT